MLQYFFYMNNFLIKNIIIKIIFIFMNITNKNKIELKINKYTL